MNKNNPSLYPVNITVSNKLVPILARAVEHYAEHLRSLNSRPLRAGDSRTETLGNVLDGINALVAERDTLELAAVLREYVK